MIHIGDKFKVHWLGHEQEYDGRIYRVTSVRSDCTCSLPSWVIGGPERPRRPHCHINAKLIRTSTKRYENNEHTYVFDGIDEETLCDIESPAYLLQIIREPGDQLSLF